MKQYFDPKINRMVSEILAGELVCTDNSGMVLTTLLGSCVSVCLADRVNGVFGINHFMLPGKLGVSQYRDPKYGTFATDLLIAEMRKKGAEKKYLEAKVFGAGKVLDKLTFDVARNNAEFIQKYLTALRIPIAASDLGNDYGRKILFFCNTGDVYVKKIREYSSNTEALARERRFFAWLKSHIGGAGHEESQGAYS